MKPHKILIADDDREHLLMVALMCRNAGYEVISAVNAQSALQLAVEQNPDLMLLDVHMDDADGYVVQERLQQLSAIAKIPVIYLTGDQSSWVESMTDILGADGVFRKPFKMEELLAAIKNVIVRRDAAVSASATERRHAVARAHLPRTSLRDEYSTESPYMSAPNHS